MSPAPFQRYGQPPTLLYKLIRLLADHVLREIEKPTASKRIHAARHGVDRSIYLRVQEFIAEHRELVLAAKNDGDWTAVEDIVFRRIPHYREYPSYAQALIEIGAASGPKPRPKSRAAASSKQPTHQQKPKRVARRPYQTRPYRKRSWLKKWLRRLQKLIG
ncbi:MAG: hypothetical protein F9K30_24075 [Dechloromonas sp.]|nr:MAG: hypothetical protein F9K30_24075 [Dechloromonas sp.]